MSHPTSDEDKATIRRMWLDKKPSGEIAKAIKSTRSAIMGHVRRMGLQGLGGSSQGARSGLVQHRRWKKPSPVIPIVIPRPVRKHGETIPWVDRDHRHCRALVVYEKGTDPHIWRTCALDRIGEEPYCAHHKAIYKIPARPR